MSLQLIGVADRGRVTSKDGDTEVGIAAAKVVLNGKDSGVYTAEDGSFLLPSVPLGPLTLTAKKEGIKFETINLVRPPFTYSSTG